MAKYYYIDKNTGLQKKYIGNVIERDGKKYGTLVNQKNEYVIKELESIESQNVITTEITSYAWKDKFGVEHDLTDECIVKDNKVIDKREYSFPIEFHEEVKEDSYYIRKDNKERFDGEVINKDNKFFAKIEKGA